MRLDALARPCAHRVAAARDALPAPPQRRRAGRAARLGALAVTATNRPERDATVRALGMTRHQAASTAYRLASRERSFVARPEESAAGASTEDVGLLCHRFCSPGNAKCPSRETRALLTLGS